MPSSRARWRLLLVLWLTWGMLGLLGCEKNKNLQAAARTQATKRRKAAPRTRRPKPRICEEGERTDIRCLAFCGATKILEFARCVKGDHHCPSGVREDKCD